MKQQHRLIIVLLIVVLFVSIVLNYLFFIRSRWYYAQLNWVRLDPLGLESHPIEKYPREDNVKTRIVFYGDSRAASWPSFEYEDYEFINRGIGAQPSAQVLQRFDQHIQTLQPEVIIVQVGVNDLKTIPLFPEQKDEIVFNLQTNIEKIVQKSIAQNSIVILTTIFPVGKVPIERSLFWSDDVEQAIREVNVFIFSLANENVVIFDAYALLVGKNGLIQPEYSKDFLHVNETGYEVLNEKLAQVIININTK